MATLKYLDGRSFLVGGPGETAGLPGFTTYRRRVKLSELNAALTTSDQLPLFTIPAGSLVLGSCIRVVTACTTGGTLQVGVTAGDVDAYGTADATSVAYNIDNVVVLDTANSDVVSTATQVDLSVITTDCDTNGVFDITLMVAAMG